EIKESVFNVYKDIEEKNISRSKAYEAQFLSDQNFIKKTGIFLKDDLWKGRDAGELLNVEIPWQGDQINFEANNQSILNLGNDVKNRLNILGDLWAQKHNDVSTAQISFSWFEKIENYDFWSFENTGPLSKFYDENPMHNLYDVEILPELEGLRDWVKLYWIMALQGKESLDVVQKRVRKLVGLLYTHGHLNSVLLGVDLLEFERTVHEVQNLKIEPFVESEIWQMRRFFFASHWLLYKAKMNAYNLELFKKLEFGKCGAIFQVGSHELMLLKPLYDRAIKPYYIQVDQILKKNGCPFRRANLVWDNSEFTKRHMKGRNFIEYMVTKMDSENQEMDLNIPPNLKSADIYEIRKFKLVARMLTWTGLSLDKLNLWEGYPSDGN
ncbi:MAG: hypothetical protein ACPGJV_13375, partial [Bacteriovoracaceae bacterium]